MLFGLSDLRSASAKPRFDISYEADMCHLIAIVIPPIVTVGYDSPLWIGPAISMVSPMLGEDWLKGQSPGCGHLEHASNGSGLAELRQIALQVPSGRGRIGERQFVLAKLPLAEDLAETAGEAVAELLAGNDGAGRR